MRRPRWGIRILMTSWLQLGGSPGKFEFSWWEKLGEVDRIRCSETIKWCLNPIRISAETICGLWLGHNALSSQDRVQEEKKWVYALKDKCFLLIRYSPEFLACYDLGLWAFIHAYLNRPRWRNALLYVSMYIFPRRWLRERGKSFLYWTNYSHGPITPINTFLICLPPVPEWGKRFFPNQISHFGNDLITHIIWSLTTGKS